jgi:parvulin-like peptidyl-prolyl isomerase
MKTVMSTIALMCLLLAATRGQAQDAPAPGKDNLLAILATVNGEPITLYDVLLDTRRVEERLAAAEKPADLAAAVRRARQQAVDNLIDRRLILAEFDARAYRVPEQLIEDLLDDLAADYAGGNRQDLAKRAKADGMTMAELRTQARERIAVDLYLDEACHRPVHITPTEVQRHYEQNLAAYMEPGRISLQVLVLAKDGKLASHPGDFPERLAAELAGADEGKFSTFVKLYSDGAERDANGHTGWLTDADLRPEFAAATKAAPGTVLGPIVLPEGLCFLRVDRRIAPRQLAFVGIREQIREELAAHERARLRREFIARLRSRAVIRTFFDEDLAE